MLHEILFALLGKVGQIIKEYEDGFQIDPEIDFVSASEKEIINSICQLGFYYK